MKKLKKIILKIAFFIVFVVGVGISQNVYATNDENLKNVTRVHFSSEVTKTYGNGDCILLENYDSNGNKIYGLIDAGRNISQNDENENSSTVVKEFLKNHGVNKLEFLAITHSHSDHNGDALTVLDNFEVDTIYMKEFDLEWSPDGGQGKYEDIIERAVAKNIKVIGVSYLSLTSSEISPSRSDDFITNTKDAKEELFEGFYYNSDDDTNIIFNFGSATIQIFNWEMFDENGNQYITGVTTNTTRKIDSSENNNSITFLLKQGDKKAFFAGDMNNTEKDEEKGILGDEDRIKDAVGKVDLLKLGHHGYEYSNTEDYINVLNPEYAVITNDIGGAYKDIANWIKENNVNYLYTTSDEYCITATITNSSVYLGFETTGSFKNINGTLYYIPSGDEYKYVDYTKIVYKLEYKEKNVEVSSWNQLKEIIDNNKNEIASIDDSNKVCTLYKLIINMKSTGDWTATDTITIEKQQNIVLTTSEDITALRGSALKQAPLISLTGSLSIGTDNMKGKITLDGNKDKVKASSTLINIENGTLDLKSNTFLCNNINKTYTRTKTSMTLDYSSFGSAIYSKGGTININGGNIVNNSQEVIYTHTLPKEMYNYYRYSTFGAGIYMINNSILNMYSGKISNNDAQNNSSVTTNSDYTNYKENRGIIQGCSGVGIYASQNSEVNLLGGEITGNTATSNATTTLKTATNKGKNTSIYSLNNSIYGVGIYVYGSKLTISNDFKIANNTAVLNSEITIEENTSIKSTANSGIRGLQGYINDSDVIINGAIISNGSLENNTKITNNGLIGDDGKGSVSTSDVGGGLDFITNTTFNVNDLKLDNCTSGAGGGIYIQSSKGSITNSSITNNKTTGNGGGIWSYSSDIKISNTTLSGNEAAYGGGIFVRGDSDNVELDNIKVTNNKATVGSGGGIYAYGNLTISGNDTIISNNTANTFGGGIMIKTKGVINSGEISNNSTTKNAGGGIRVDGKLILNGGTIKNNISNTTGGGVDYTSGTFYYTAGTIENNIAGTDGDEIYPINNSSNDTTKPVIEIGEISNNWTNEDVIVTINASDNETDIQKVTVNETEIKGSNGIYTYTATTNGTYEVIAIDNAGNKTTKNFTISYIDKTAPKIIGVVDDTTYSEEITINATDKLSGIKSITLTKDGTRIDYTLGEKLTSSGEYTIVVEDSASNKSTVTFKIDRTLKDDEIVISGLSSNWTNQDTKITLTINNEIKSIKINNVAVTLSDGKYEINATTNEVYTIEIIDLDGNTIIKKVEVSNIDKDSPIIYGIIDGKVYKEETKLIIRDEQSGIASIIITKDGKETTYTDGEITISENGTYQIKVKDNVGNEKTMNFTIKINNDISSNDNQSSDEEDKNYDEITKGEDYSQENKIDDIINKEDNTQKDNNTDNKTKENVSQNEDEKIKDAVLPETGVKRLIIYFIVCLTISFALYIKLRSYKDIK